MMTNLHYSTCPIIRQSTMPLWQTAVIGGERSMQKFEREIIWLRESESKIVLRHRGVQVDNLSTLNDWYGFLTSLEHAIRSTKDYAKRFKIKRHDALALEVDLVISEVPVIIDTSKEGVTWNADADRKRYIGVPNWSNGGCWYTSDKPVSPGSDAFTQLETHSVKTVKAIYSTAQDAIGTIPKRITKFIDEQRRQAP